MVKALLRRMVILLIAGLMLSPVSASATDLEWLYGNWRGPGSFMGKPTTLRVIAGPSLGRAFTGIFITVDGPDTRFEGMAMYKKDVENRFSGQWTDSQGSMFSIAGSVEGRRLMANWGTAEMQGRSSYTLKDDGSLEVVDSILQKGGDWQEFGRHLLRKEDMPLPTP